MLFVFLGCKIDDFNRKLTATGPTIAERSIILWGTHYMNEIGATLRQCCI